MKCHFCGKEVWLVRHLRDGDFCSAEHRRKYHERLRRSFEQLPQHDSRPARLAEFCLNVAVAEPSARARGATEFAHDPGARVRMRASLAFDVTPVLGHSFLGVPEASEVTFSLGHTPADLQPLPPALRMPAIGASCSIGGSTVPRLQAAIDLPATCAAAPAPAAMLDAPNLLDRGFSEPAYPSMALQAILGDGGLDAGLAPPVAGDERRNGSAAVHQPQPPARGTRCLPLLQEPPRIPVRPLADATAVFTMAPGLGLPGATLDPGGCLPPVVGHPLLLDPAYERAESAAERTRPAIEPLPRTIHAAILPAAPLPRRPQPARESRALNGPHPIAPWEIPMPAVEPVAPKFAALLPAFTFAPAGAALPNDTSAAPLAARANEAPSDVRGALGMQNGIPAPPSPAPAWPALPVSGKHATLPAIGMPRPVDPSTVAPQTQVAAPASEDRLLLASRMATPAIHAQSSTSAQARLRIMQGMTLAVASVQPTLARVDSGTEPLPQISAIATATAIPDRADYRRLVQAPAGPIAPTAVTCTARPSVPTPEALAQNALSFRALSLTVGGASVFAPADSLPVEVYVQRGRTRVRRDVEWQPVCASTSLPVCTLDQSPARFEQLVLQDWRRRYPSRTGPVLKPLAQTGGKKVLAMPQPFDWRQRLRDGRRFATAAAASIVLCAGTWFAWSSGSLNKMTAGDREWFKQAVARRATFQVADNFRSGLSLWDGRKNWQRSWGYSTDGFMRTGQLALYRPSQQLTNYRLEFFGQIEKKSMGVAVRTLDSQNYYAMKFTVTEPGPRPLISVVRYPVIDGKKGRKVQIPVTMMVHNNTPYRVAVDVRGNRFRAFIEDQEVDFWSDNRLARGGVGFFSENDERARLYWVKVSHNDDWLGRLCGMLAGNAAVPNEALNLWQPEGDAGRTLAAVDRTGVWDAAKNIDRKRTASVVGIETQA